MKQLIEALAKVQRTLNAPKSQLNKFGGYNYRSCEDILQAVKPLLNGCVITITDNIEQVGDRYYIKATATFTDGDGSISSVAYAREELSKKGMDASQITGSASSYARKYALNGLLLIDDNKDADSHDNRNHNSQQQTRPVAKPRQHPNEDQRAMEIESTLQTAEHDIKRQSDPESLKSEFARWYKWAKPVSDGAVKRVQAAYERRKAELASLEDQYESAVKEKEVEA